MRIRSIIIGLVHGVDCRRYIEWSSNQKKPSYNLWRSNQKMPYQQHLETPSANSEKKNRNKNIKKNCERVSVSYCAHAIYTDFKCQRGQIWKKNPNTHTFIVRIYVRATAAAKCLCEYVWFKQVQNIFRTIQACISFWYLILPIIVCSIAAAAAQND